MAILLLEKALAKNAAATKATKYKGISICERESEICSHLISDELVFR